MHGRTPSARASESDGPEDRVREPDPPASGFATGIALSGELNVPGSKSIAQRVLVCAGLSSGGVSIAGLPDGDDVKNACALIAECGAIVSAVLPSAVHVRGAPPGMHGGWAPSRPVKVGESGTLARLATAAIALCGRAGSTIEIHVDGSLRRRHSGPLFDALRRAEVRIEACGERVPSERDMGTHGERKAGERDVDTARPEPRGWPVRISPLGPPSDLHLSAPTSSQEVSALLIALAAYPDALRLHVRGEIPSRPYVELTLAVLDTFGVRVECAREPDGERFVVRGPLRAPDDAIAIEPDASSAAVALAAACLSDGHVAIPGLTSRSRQGDLRIVQYLQRMGSRAGVDAERAWAGGFPVRPIDVDLSGEPDLAPVIAALAAGVASRAPAGAEAASRLTGLATLAGKESSRVEVLARGLTSAGFVVRHGADFLSVLARADGSRGRIGRSDGDGERQVLLDPDGDHRMAFAFALLSLFVDGVRVRDAHCVSKSWPRFWSDMQKVGARMAT